MIQEKLDVVAIEDDLLEYSYLEPILDSRDRHKIVAKNIRAMLKKFKMEHPEFKDVKFSVVRPYYAKISVTWKNGPEQSVIYNLLSCFVAGYFDGQIDSYSFNTGVPAIFNHLFGEVQYLYCQRETI